MLDTNHKEFEGEVLLSLEVQEKMRKFINALFLVLRTREYV